VSPDDRERLRRLFDRVSNALQAAVLVAEHLELASAATAQDAHTITQQLRRATLALREVLREGGEL